MFDKLFCHLWCRLLKSVLDQVRSAVRVNFRIQNLFCRIYCCLLPDDDDAVDSVDDALDAWILFRMNIIVIFRKILFGDEILPMEKFKIYNRPYKIILKILSRRQTCCLGWARTLSCSSTCNCCWRFQRTGWFISIG